MLECPICRRSYDGRFQVFVPQHSEGFDTIECARRAAALDWPAAGPMGVLPKIEIVPPPPGPAPSRWSIAALAAIPPGQAALATGVGLMAAGTAASIYLWAAWPAKQVLSIAAGITHTRLTPVPPTRAALPSTGAPTAEAPGPAVAERPAAPPRSAGPDEGASEAPPNRSAVSRAAPSVTRIGRTGPKSAAEAQYGRFQPPFASVSG